MLKYNFKTLFIFTKHKNNNKKKDFKPNSNFGVCFVCGATNLIEFAAQCSSNFSTNLLDSRF
jgi:hypothetical protein